MRMTHAFRKRVALLSFLVQVVCLLTMTGPAAQAQQVKRGRGQGSGEARRRASRGGPRSALIARIVSEIDARNIERTSNALVSFGTRNTLSAQDDPKRGIGAARDWLYGEFARIAAGTRRSVGGENDSSSRQLARYIKEIGPRYVPGMNVSLIYRRDRYLRGGDHIPFLERGYPAVRFCEPNENYNHQHQNVRVENGVQ